MALCVRGAGGGRRPLGQPRATSWVSLLISEVREPFLSLLPAPGAGFRPSPRQQERLSARAAPPPPLDKSVAGRQLERREFCLLADSITQPRGGGVLPARLQAWGGSPGDSVSLGSAASGTMHTPARAAGSRRHRRAERQDPANVQKANALAGCHGNAACGAGSAQALGSALKAASAFGSAPVFWLGDP